MKMKNFILSMILGLAMSTLAYAEIENPQYQHMPLVGRDGVHQQEHLIIYDRLNHVFKKDRNFNQTVGESIDGSYSFGLAGDYGITGNWMGATVPGRKVGVYRSSPGHPPRAWLDLNGNNSWDFNDRYYSYGSPGDIGIAGSWTYGGNHPDSIGVYRPSTRTFYLDRAPWPGDGGTYGTWDNQDFVVTVELPTTAFDFTNAWPVAVSRGNSGRTVPGIYVRYQWMEFDSAVLFYDSNGDRRIDVGDNSDLIGNWSTFPKLPIVFQALVGYRQRQIGMLRQGSVPVFAVHDDIPVVGEWNADGISRLGIYRSSQAQFSLDTHTDSWDGNSSNTSHDTRSGFGFRGDLPIVGRWHAGATTSQLGVFRPSNATFYLDSHSTSTERGWDSYDSYGQFGYPGDIPVAVDLEGDGVDVVGVYRPYEGKFYIDNNGNLHWDQGESINAICADYLIRYKTNPVVGDFDGDGRDDLGCCIDDGSRSPYTTCRLDKNHNGTLDSNESITFFNRDSDTAIPFAGKLEAYRNSDLITDYTGRRRDLIGFLSTYIQYTATGIKTFDHFFMDNGNFFTDPIDYMPDQTIYDAYTILYVDFPF